MDDKTKFLKKSPAGFGEKEHLKETVTSGSAPAERHKDRPEREDAFVADPAARGQGQAYLRRLLSPKTGRGDDPRSFSLKIQLDRKRFLWYCKFFI